MNRVIAAIIFLALLVVGKAADLKTYKGIFDTNLEEIVLGHGPNMEALQQQYGKAIESLKSKLQEQGDLEKTMAVLAEIKRFENDRVIPASLPEKEIPELKSLQAKFIKQLSYLELDKARRIVTLANQYDSALDKLQKELTRAGQFDEASAVRDERNKVKNSDYLIAATRVTAAAGEDEDDTAGKNTQGADKSRDEEVRPAGPKLPTPAGCILYFDFEDTKTVNKDEKEIILLKDKSGSGNNAVMEGGQLERSSYGQCAVISRGLDIIRMNKPLEVGDTWTITFNIKLKSPWRPGQRIVTYNAPWHSHIVISAIGVPFSVASLPGGFKMSEANLSDLSGWHHIAAVGQHGETTFYLDGKDAGRAACQEKGPIVCIGNYVSGGQPLRNPIDNFMVFKTALTPSAIASLARR